MAVFAACGRVHGYSMRLRGKRNDLSGSFAIFMPALILGREREEGPLRASERCIKNPVLPSIPLRQRFSSSHFDLLFSKNFQKSFSESPFHTDKMAGRDHVLGLPSFVLAFRILQLVTALAIMGLAAYGITYLSFDGVDLTLFTVHPPFPSTTHPPIFPFIKLYPIPTNPRNRQSQP